MSSSTSTPSAPSEAPPVRRWRRWPLVDGLPRSLVAPLGVLAIAVAARYAVGSWLMGMAALAALVAALATYFLPVRYELHAGGFRSSVLGRFGGWRLVPWRAIRCYQPRATGILLFRRPDPIPPDSFHAHFLPYDDDPDELLCAVRQYLPHAEELPGEW